MNASHTFNPKAGKGTFPNQHPLTRTVHSEDAPLAHRHRLDFVRADARVCVADCTPCPRVRILLSTPGVPRHENWNREKGVKPALNQQSTVSKRNLKVAICTSIKNEKPEDMQEWVQYYKYAALLLCASCMANAILKSTK